MKRIYLGVLALVTAAAVIIGIANHVPGIRADASGDSRTWEISFGNRQDAAVDQTLEEFSAVDLDVNAAELTITSGSSYRLTSSLELVYEIKNGTLTVTDQTAENTINSKNGYIDLEVPADVTLEDVALKLNAGDIEISDLTAKTLQTEQNSGDFEMTDSTADQLIAAGGAGDIELSNVSAETITVTGSTGDVEVSDCDFEVLDVSINTGDIEVSAVPEREYAVDLQTNTGEIEVNGEDYHRSFAGGDSAKYKISLTTNTGDIDLMDLG